MGWVLSRWEWWTKHLPEKREKYAFCLSRGRWFYKEQFWRNAGTSLNRNPEVPVSCHVTKKAAHPSSCWHLSCYMDQGLWVPAIYEFRKSLEGAGIVAHEANSPLCRTTIPYGLWFMFRLLHFQSIPLLMTWDWSREWAKASGPCTHREYLKEAPGSWLLNPYGRPKEVFDSQLWTSTVLTCGHLGIEPVEGRSSSLISPLSVTSTFQFKNKSFYCFF